MKPLSPVFSVIMRTRLLCLLSALFLSSCSVLDNWMNGEDNTPPPSELTALDSAQASSIRYQLLWQQDSGVGSAGAFVMLYPAINGETISVIDREGKLSQYNRHNGKRLWQQDYDMVITGGLGSSPDYLFFSNDQGELIAVKQQDGALAWKKSLSSISLSRVLAVDETLVVRTLDGKLYGLQQDSGEQLWIYDRGVPVLTYRGNSAPVAGPDNLFFTGFDSGKVVALDAGQGRKLWEVTAAIPKGRSDIERLVDIDADPLLIDDTLFVVTFNGRIIAIDIDTTKLLWARKLSSQHAMSSDTNKLYVVDTEDNIWSIDQLSGNFEWKQDQLKYRHLTPGSVLDQTFYTLDFEGYLHALSTTDGHIISRHQFDSSGYTIGPLRVRDDEQPVLYLYSNAGQLSAVQVQSENP